MTEILCTEFRKGLQHIHTLLHSSGRIVPMNSWQSQDVKAKPGMSYSRELMNYSFIYRFPNSIEELQGDVAPNLPWAEDHFQERVGGEPVNPPPSEAWWPYRVKNNLEHKDQAEQFSHTYPERIWPRFANIEGKMSDSERQVFVPHVGVRYQYGDLIDVVNLLHKDPLTRQAYLPIWFPEDTGAVSGQRVPCTLGYQFMLRPAVVKHGHYDATIVYHIRSCDIFRHFTDDVYMACRLLQWVVGNVRDRSGIDADRMTLAMHISSLHSFEGDEYMLKQLAEGRG